METALASLASGVNAVAGVDVGTVAVGVLGPSILGLQVEIDRLRVVQAHWLQAADVHRIWETSGHRDIASWLAAKGKTSKRTARAAAALGDGLARHAELDAKVAAGKISSDAAQALLPVLDGPHSGDPNVLLDACDGATPFDAKAAAIKFKATNPPLGETAADREAELFAGRYLAFPDNSDGTNTVVGQLTTEHARTVETALASLAGKPGIGD